MTDPLTVFGTDLARRRMAPAARSPTSARSAATRTSRSSTPAGTVEFDPDLVKPDRLRDFIAYAGREVGIGACRKLGWGRFIVLSLSED